MLALALVWESACHLLRSSHNRKGNPMSVLLENKAEAKLQTGAAPRLHLHMAYASLVVIAWIACRTTAIEIPRMADFVIEMAFACAVVLTVIIFWYRKGKTNYNKRRLGDHGLEVASL